MLLRSIGVTGVFVGAHAVADGVVTRRQLQAGLYRRVLHGVYANPALPRDHELRCRAAALLMPRAAALGGRSAAGLLGGPSPRFADPVTVVVPPEVPWRGPRGVRVHRADLPSGDVLVKEDGLRVTTDVRTAWDVAALEPTGIAVAVLDDMLRRGRLQETDLRRLEREGAGRWGVRGFRRAAGLVDARAESPPESSVRVACALAGLPTPVPQFDVVDRDVWLARVDLAWPEARLIVEYEGEHHFQDLQIVRDDARLERLVAAGWRVIRLSAADLRDMEAVVRRIHDALGARADVG